MSETSEQPKSQAYAFEILAKALPEMVAARAKSPKIVLGVPGQMGYITSKVAKHLGVEICTIFLLESDEKGERLVLAEAFGYADDAIGKIKSLDKGITGIIAGLGNTGVGKDVVCNFTVQDHPAWAGQLDTELPRHGWTLLGASIVGADNKPKGVIKFENKKSRSHSEHVSALLSSMASRVNTPGKILEETNRLVEAVKTVLPEDVRLQKAVVGHLEVLLGIAEQLGNGCRQLSFDVDRGSNDGSNPESLKRLEESEQQERMEELELQTAALAEALHHLERSLEVYSSPNHAVETALRQLQNTAHVFALAIRAYTPFSRSDVYLVRAVAALIAAAMDISEGQAESSLHALQHGLRHGTNWFLLHVQELTEHSVAVWKRDNISRESLSKLWLTALNISGPQDAIGAMGDVEDSDKLPLSQFADKLLSSRLRYYRDCAVVWNKQFPDPDDILEGWLKNPSVGSHGFPNFLKYLLLGACDILFCNAIEYGGSCIGVELKYHNGRAIILFLDDGPGIQLGAIAALEGQAFGLSKRSRFGLKAAKHVLARHGAELIIVSNPQQDETPGTKTCVAISFPIEL